MEALPTQAYEDFMIPLPEASPKQALTAQLFERSTTGGYTADLPRAPLETWGDWTSESPEDVYREQTPFLTPSINLATGEMMVAPLSLLEANRLMTAASHTGGMWSQNAQNQQLAANLMFAGREKLKNTWLDITNKMVNVEGEDEPVKVDQFLLKWISEWSASNWMKGFTGTGEYSSKSRIFSHFEPMLISGDGWYDTPYDLFDVEGHVFSDEEKAKIKESFDIDVPDAYTSDFMYDYMWKTNPGYMATIESLGGTKEGFTDARNQFEWMYQANMMIEMNYAQQSILWSDKNSNAFKHFAGGVYSFTVDGILNEPDMVGEIIVGLVLSAATAGGSAVAVGSRLLLKMRRLGKAGLDIQKELQMLRRVTKMRKVTNFLPSALPHTIMTRGGKIKTSWYNPFANKGRNLFFANAAEGALTGGLAEIRNQWNKQEYGMMDEMDWGLVGFQSLMEAAITPFINPAFTGLMKGGQMVGLYGVVKASDAAAGTGFSLSPNFKLALNSALTTAFATEDNIQQAEAQILSNLIAGRLYTQFGSLESDGSPITTTRLTEILATVVQDMGLSELEQIELDLSLMIEDATETDADGNQVVNPEKLDLIRAVSQLAGMYAKAQGLDAETVATRSGLAFLLMLGDRAAAARNKSGHPKEDKKPWTARDIIQEVFGEGDVGDVSLFFDEAMRGKVNEHLKDKMNIEPEAAENIDVATAWENVLREEGTIFSTKAFELANEKAEVVKEAKQVMADMLKKLGMKDGQESLFLRELFLNSDVVEQRITDIKSFIEALTVALNKMRSIKSGRTRKLNNGRRKILLRILKNVTASTDMNILTDLLIALSGAGIKVEVEDGASATAIATAISKSIEADTPPALAIFQGLAEATRTVINEEEAAKHLGPTEDQKISELDVASAVLLNTIVRGFYSITANTEPRFFEGAEAQASLAAFGKLVTELESISGFKVELFTGEEGQEGYTVDVTGTEGINTVTILNVKQLLIRSGETGKIMQKGKVELIHQDKDLFFDAGTEVEPTVEPTVETEVEPTVETEVEPAEDAISKKLKKKKKNVEDPKNSAPEVLLSNINYALEKGLITDLQATVLKRMAEDVSKGKRSLLDFNGYVESNINTDAGITNLAIRAWLQAAYELSQAGVAFTNRLLGETVEPTVETRWTHPFDVAFMEAFEALANELTDTTKEEADAREVPMPTVPATPVGGVRPISLETRTIYENIDRMLVEAREQEDAKAIEILTALSARLRYFEDENKDMLPSTTKILELVQNRQRLKKELEALDKKYFGDKKYAKAHATEQQANIFQQIFESFAQKKKKEQAAWIPGEQTKALIEAIEKTQGLKPKKKDLSWSDRMHKLAKHFKESAASMSSDFESKKAKYSEEASVLRQEDKENTRLLQRESFKANLLAIRASMHNEPAFHMKDAKQFGALLKDARMDIDMNNVRWENHWDKHDTAELDWFLPFFLGNKETVKAQIIKKHGKKDSYTKKELEPYFKKHQQAATDRIAAIQYSQVILTGRQIADLARGIIEEDVRLIDDWPSTKPFIQLNSVEARAEMLAEGHGKVSHIASKVDAAVALSVYARRLLNVINTGEWGGKNLTYAVLKEAFKGTGLDNVRPELIFKNVGNISPHDAVRVNDLEFEVAEVSKALALLMARLDTNMREGYRYTAESLLEAMSDPSNTHSQYSIYAALSVITLMQKGMQEMNIGDFASNLQKNNGKAYKLFKADSEVVAWGTDVEFMAILAESMDAYLKDMGDVKFKALLSRLGYDPTTRVTDLKPNELLNKIAVYLAEDGANTKFFTDLGNGQRDYITAENAGKGLIDLVLGRAPGTVSRVINKTDAIDVQENWSEITDQAVDNYRKNKSKGTDEDIDPTQAESRILLPPQPGDINFFAPLEEWSYMAVLEDAIFRNRAKWVVNVEITPEMVSEWKHRTIEDMPEVHPLFATPNRTPFRLAPFISNRSSGQKVLSREALNQAMYELMLDMSPVMEMFIHDAIYGWGQHYRQGEAVNSEIITTGFPTVVPSTNMGWLSILHRLQPALLNVENRNNTLIRLVLEQALRIESKYENFADAVKQENVADQSFQGLHLFLYQGKTGEEIMNALNDLAAHMDNESADGAWKVDLEDRYVTSAIAWMHPIIDGSKDPAMSKFVKLFENAGIKKDTTYEEIKTMLDDPDSNLSLMRDVLFKPGPLMKLYSGGVDAFVNYVSDLQQSGQLVKLNEAYDVDINMTDVKALGDFLFTRHKGETESLISSAMGFTGAVKRKAYEALGMSDKGSGGALLQRAMDKAGSAEARAELQAYMDAMPEGDAQKETIKYILRANDSIDILDARIAEIAEFTGRSKKEVEEVYGARLEEVRKFLEDKQARKEPLTRADQERINEMLLGDTIGWKDIAALRGQNLQNSVAHEMMPDILDIQSKILGIPFSRSDMMGLQDHSLFFTYARSHNSTRWFQTVFDVMNIHPVNMDASKVATRIKETTTSADFIAKRQEFKDDTSLDLSEELVAGELSELDIYTLSWMGKNRGDAPFGMWNLSANKAYALREKYALDETGAFVNEDDRVAWRQEAEHMIDTLLMRDEMLYEASLGPIALEGYGTKPVFDSDGVEIPIISEANPDLLFQELGRLWQEENLKGDADYAALRKQVRAYESLRKASKTKEAAAMYTDLLILISKWEGIPIEELMDIKDIGARVASMRYPKEFLSTPTAREGDAGDVHSLLGIRTAYSGGVAALRPLMRTTSFDQTGSLELRRMYYENLVNELEYGVKENAQMDSNLNEDLETILPEEVRTDVDLFDTNAMNLMFPEWVGNERRSLLAPKQRNTQVDAFRVKQELAKWALHQGYDMSFLEGNKDMYPIIYYLYELDKLFGYIDSATAHPDSTLNYNVMMRLRSVKDALTSEKADAVHRAKYDLVGEIRKLYRISNMIKTRGTSYLHLHDTGATTGVVKIPEDTDLTIEEMLTAGMTGEHGLMKALKIGLQAKTLTTVDSTADLGQFVETSNTLEGTMFMQGIDGNLLVTKLADQLGIMDYVTTELINTHNVDSKAIAKFKEGSYSAVINPDTGISIEVFTDILLEGLNIVQKDSITNYRLAIEFEPDADNRLVPLKMSVMTRGKDKGGKGVYSVVKNDPMSSGILLGVPTTIVGEKKTVLLTPESFFHAINTLSNFAEIESMEYAIRTGQHVGIRKSVDSQGAITRSPRQPLSRQLRYDEGFNFEEDRANASAIYDIMALLTEDESLLHPVNDDSRGTKYLDATAYLGSTVEIKLHEGVDPIMLPMYQAALILPVQRIMSRLNKFGATRSLKEVSQYINIDNHRIMLLGLMIRNPKITLEEVLVLAPFINEELKSDSRASTYEDGSIGMLKEKMAHAQELIEFLITELKWREMSPDMSMHVINAPLLANGTYGWQAKANPFVFLSRTFWEQASVDTDIYSNELDFFNNEYMPWIEKRWDKIKSLYAKHPRGKSAEEHQSMLVFLEENMHTLAYMSYLDSLETVFMPRLPEAGARPEGNVLTILDSRWRDTARVDANTVKRLRKTQGLLEEYAGNEEVYSHLVRLTNNIDSITRSETNATGIINEATADALRSAFGFLAKINPEIVVNVELTKDSLGGMRVGFAQKIYKPAADVKIQDVYTADVDSPHYVADEAVRDFKNMMLFTGTSHKDIDAMPEFDPAWILDSGNVVGLDIETNITTNLDARRISVASIVAGENSTADFEGLTIFAGDKAQSLTKAEAKKILDTLEGLQNAGVKVATFNGNSFDLLTLGRVAQSETQAARVALRSFDIYQSLKYSKTGRADFRHEDFNLNDTALSLLGKEKIETSGKAAMMYQAVMGQEITLNDKASYLEYQEIVRLSETAEGKIVLKQALSDYVQADSAYTSDILSLLLDARQSDNKTVKIKHKSKGPVQVRIQDLSQSWGTGHESGQLPHSMIDWHGEGLVAPRNARITGDPTLDPGYIIGLDPGKLASMDTASAIDVLFHELTEVAILKYMNEDSTNQTWGNMIRELRRPESIALLERLILQQEGGKGSPQARAKLDYAQSSDSELVAAFGSYYLAARVLGDPDGVIKPIVDDMRKQSWFGNLQSFMNRVYTWVAESFNGMAHVFVEYADESPRDFGDLMTMFDAVFGLDENGARMPDVGRAASERRYTKVFSQETAFDTGILDKGAIPDADYVAAIDERASTKKKMEALGETKSDAYTRLAEDKLKLDNILAENGYANPDKTGLYEEGINAMGLTRADHLSFNRAVKTNFNRTFINKNIKVDGLHILKTDNIKLKAAFAQSLLEAFSEYLGGRYKQGIGGRVRELIESGSYRGKAAEWYKKWVALSSSGANKTYNSPYDAVVIMANMLVDGAILTTNNILPSSTKGVISVQKTHGKARIFDTAISQGWNLDIMPVFKKDPLYASSEEADAVYNLETDVFLHLINQDHDLSIYSPDTQKAIKLYTTEYKSFLTDTFTRNKNNGRAYIEKDAEIFPWKIKDISDGLVRDAMGISFRGAIKELTNERLLAEEEYPNPVLLWSMELLPRPAQLSASLAKIKNNFPGWYNMLGQMALDNYKAATGLTSTTLQGFLAMEPTGDSARAAWTSTTAYILSAHGDKAMSWESHRGYTPFDKKLDIAEEHKTIRDRYNSTREGSTVYTGGDAKAMRSILSELVQINTKLDRDIFTYFLSRGQDVTEQWENVTDFLTSAFISRIGDRAFFVYDSRWIPKVSEAAHIPAIRNYIEFNTATLAGVIAKTQGHQGLEIDAFAELTGTNLSYGEMLQLFADVTDPNAMNGAIRMGDGQGGRLSLEEQTAIHDSFSVVFPKKYNAIKGLTAKYGKNQDAALEKLAPASNDIIKMVYGTNLAFASAFVEGSMAGVMSAVGHQNIVEGILFPFMSYFGPLAQKSPEVARDMLYAIRSSMGETTAGFVDLDSGSAFFSGRGGTSKLSTAANWVTNHATHVNQALRGKIDLLHRRDISRFLTKGSWRSLIDIMTDEVELNNYNRDPEAWKKKEISLAEAHNRRHPKLPPRKPREYPGYRDKDGKIWTVEELLSEDKTSWKVWKKLAAEAGWGKGRTSQWRMAMILAKNNLMTHEALDAFILMDQGAREIAKDGSSEEYFHLYKMRQWAQMEGGASLSKRMEVHGNMVVAMQELVEIIVTAPNVLDLNVGSSAVMAVLHQYRTYPMLFTSQRLIRDASTFSPAMYMTKLLGAMTLDMMYTLLTMMAGGYRYKDMMDDMEDNPTGFVSLLMTRLPLFGFWGMGAVELLHAMMVAKSPGTPFTPISLAGLVKYITGLRDVGTGVVEGLVPGGETWDKDRDTGTAINLLRMVPYLGETIVRILMHSAIRTRRARGGLSRFGGGKVFNTFGANQGMVSLEPRVVLENLMGELFPGLFPENFDDLDYDDYLAIRQGVRRLKDNPDISQAKLGDVPPGTAPPRTTGRYPTTSGQGLGQRIEAPSGLTGSEGTKFLKSPL